MKKMEQKTVIMIVLGVLVLIAAVQAYQFSELKTQLAGGSRSVSTVSAPASSGSPQLPSNLQNLPQMVGGC